MSFLEQLKNGKMMQFLAGVVVNVVKQSDGKLRYFVQLTGKSDKYVLLGLQFGSQILARFPKNESRGYELASTLERMVNLIVNEGIWPNSDLIRYADATGVMELSDHLNNEDGDRIEAALIISSAGEAPTLVFSEPLEVSDEALLYAVIAVWQALVGVLDNTGVERFDRALRYFKSYLDDGICCADPIVAASLANRAFSASFD